MSSALELYALFWSHVLQRAIEQGPEKDRAILKEAAQLALAREIGRVQGRDEGLRPSNVADGDFEYDKETFRFLIESLPVKQREFYLQARPGDAEEEDFESEDEGRAFFVKTNQVSTLTRLYGALSADNVQNLYCEHGHDCYDLLIEAARTGEIEDSTALAAIRDCDESGFVEEMFSLTQDLARHISNARRLKSKLRARNDDQEQAGAIQLLAQERLRDLVEDLSEPPAAQWLRVLVGAVVEQAVIVSSFGYADVVALMNSLPLGNTEGFAAMRPYVTAFAADVLLDHDDTLRTRIAATESEEFMAELEAAGGFDAEIRVGWFVLPFGIQTPALARKSIWAACSEIVKAFWDADDKEDFHGLIETAELGEGPHFLPRLKLTARAKDAHQVITLEPWEITKSGDMLTWNTPVPGSEVKIAVHETETQMRLYGAVCRLWLQHQAEIPDEA